MLNCDPAPRKKQVLSTQILHRRIKNLSIEHLFAISVFNTYSECSDLKRQIT